MKALRNIIAMLLIVLTTATANAQPMSYYSMRNNARFLTDRMAYTLGLSAAIIDDLYLINYDYICGVNDYLDDVALGYRYDDYMEVIYARDYALRRLLTERQWALLMTYDYFYRPITFINNRWSFGIYAYDTHRTHFYYSAPRRFHDYRGGHFFRGMRPAPHINRPANIRPVTPPHHNNVRPPVNNNHNRLDDMRHGNRPNNNMNDFQSRNPRQNDRPNIINNNRDRKDSRDSFRGRNEMNNSNNNNMRIQAPHVSNINSNINSNMNRNLTTRARSISEPRSMGGGHAGMRVGRR